MGGSMRVEWRVEEGELCVDGQAIPIPGPVHTVIFTKQLAADRRFAVFVDERMLTHLRALLEDLMRQRPEPEEVGMHMIRVNALGRLLRECRAVMHEAV